MLHRSTSTYLHCFSDAVLATPWHRYTFTPLQRHRTHRVTPWNRYTVTVTTCFTVTSLHIYTISTIPCYAMPPLLRHCEMDTPLQLRRTLPWHRYTAAPLQRYRVTPWHRYSERHREITTPLQMRRPLPWHRYKAASFQRRRVSYTVSPLQIYTITAAPYTPCNTLTSLHCYSYSVLYRDIVTHQQRCSDTVLRRYTVTATPCYTVTSCKTFILHYPYAHFACWELRPQIPRGFFPFVWDHKLF